MFNSTAKLNTDLPNILKQQQRQNTRDMENRIHVVIFWIIVVLCGFKTNSTWLENHDIQIRKILTQSQREEKDSMRFTENSVVNKDRLTERRIQ